MRGVVLTMLAKLPDFWVGRFDDLAKDRHRAVDKTKHDELVRTAERCIRDQDIDGLREATFKMTDNMVRSADVTKPDALAGLMK
jgi:hypothetical protein